MSTLFSRILLPTDFSEAGRPAAAYACEMVRQFNAALYCLHVVDDSYQYWSAWGPHRLIVAPPPQQLTQAPKTRLQRYCAEYLRDLPHPAVELVSLGSPFVEIIGHAKEHAIDLIVMGTHGRGAIAHALLGGTTEKIVRKAPCAVLTVRAIAQQLAP